MQADDSDSGAKPRRSGRRSWASYRSRPRRKRRLKSLVAPMLVVLAIVDVVTGGVAYLGTEAEPEVVAVTSAHSHDAIAKPKERTAALAPLNLPADDGAHGSGMEWWYYNGILNSKTDARYAFHVAVFVANGLVKHSVTHVALTNLQTGKRYSGQRRTGGMPGSSAATGFDFKQDGWQVSASGPAHIIRADFEGVSIALDLNDTGQPVAHRAADSDTPGLLDFGSSGISYYYSRPRVAARGFISVAGTAMPVSGEVWFDHQWGDFDVLTLGWNWLALHLENGSDVMLYALFDAEGRSVLTAGTVSNAKGSSPISPGEVELTPGNVWTSPHTRITYPVEWKLKLRSDTLNIKPFVADSEFDASTTTANVYWEGPVKVFGSSSGEGFMELSGYDRLKTAQPYRK